MTSIPRGLPLSYAVAGSGRPSVLAVREPRAKVQQKRVRRPGVVNERRRLVDLAAKNRLPPAYAQREFVDAGGRMSYGANVADSFRRAATDVDRILKGAKPEDLPVEQPTKFELTFNLKAAKALGLAVPPSVLARADQVVEK